MQLTKITNNLAPIALSTYSRLKHLQRTVESLQKNELATASELFIFSDAPKQGDEEKVQAVRDYLKTITGFKKISIYERKKNNRVANNRGGIRMLFEQYDSLIFIEEDCVLSPLFLNFINKALEIYKDDQSIFSICAYTPPIKIMNNYKYNVIKSFCFFAWGFAIWKNRFDSIRWNTTAIEWHKLKNDSRVRKRLRITGWFQEPQCQMDIAGVSDALDIKIAITAIFDNKYFISPTKSLVNNIGLDGSGEHWTEATNKFSHELIDHQLNLCFEHNIPIFPKIINSYAYYLDYGMKGRVIIFLRKLGLLKSWRTRH